MVSAASSAQQFSILSRAFLLLVIVLVLLHLGIDLYACVRVFYHSSSGVSNAFLQCFPSLVLNPRNWFVSPQIWLAGICLAIAVFFKVREIRG